MSDNIDKEFNLSIAGALAFMAVGYLISLYFDAGSLATGIVSAVGWVVGLFLTTFLVVE